MITFHNNPVVDIHSDGGLLEGFLRMGLNIRNIERGNYQELRSIGGLGYGQFILTEDISEDYVDVVWHDNNAIKVGILQKEIIGNTKTGTNIFVYRTVQHKFSLSDDVQRDYNVIIRKSVNDSGEGYALSPDQPFKTLTEIVEDIVPVGITVDSDAQAAIKPYNVPIEGMLVWQAIDLLCSNYGLLWELDDTTLYIRKPTDITSNDPSPPTTRIKQMERETFDNFTLSICNPIFRVVKESDNWRQNGYTSTVTSGTASEYYEHIYNIFVPEVYGPNNTVGNNVATQNQLISDNLNNIFRAPNYFVRGKGDRPELQTEQYLRTIMDDLKGDREVLNYVKDYPMIRCPNVVTHEAHDGLADNMLAAINPGYYGSGTTEFSVSPEHCLDGTIPAGNEYQEVYNYYSYDYGSNGQKIRLEWDYKNARWIPLMQAYTCPPDTDPGFTQQTTVEPYTIDDSMSSPELIE